MPNILTKSQQELFDHWYRFYPLKKAVGYAWKAWVKLNPDAVLVARMVIAIENQKIERQRKVTIFGTFVPDWKHPATWLSGRCWEDEPETVKSRQAIHDENVEVRMMECPSCRRWTFNSERCSKCGFSR